MKKQGIVFLGLAGLLALLGGCYQEKSPRSAPAQPPAEATGQPAPEIEGATVIQGDWPGLAGLRGKVVLLDFWAVWCPPCRALFPQLHNWHQQFHTAGLEIVGLTRYYREFAFDPQEGRLLGDQSLSPSEEVQMLRDFARHHHLEHPLLVLDDAHWRRVARDYGVEAFPTLVLIDKKGIINMVKVGSQPDHLEALEQAIRQLLDQ